MTTAQAADGAPVAGGFRNHGIQVFSAASDAPRVRRSSDAASAVVTALLVVLLVFVVGDGTAFDEAWADLVDRLPGWVQWLSQLVYVVGLAYGAGLLVGIAVFARGRAELVRDLLLSAALAVVSALVLTQVVDDRWPAVQLTDLDRTTTTFPAFLVTALVAVQASAAPHLSTPVRRIGWTTAVGAVAGAMVGGAAQPSDLAGAVLVGLFSAALVRLVLGTTSGIPSLGRIRDGLTRIGASVSELQYLPEQPTHSTLVDGTIDDGRAVRVRVLGRDAWNNRRWSRAWRFAWYQDGDPQYGSTRREQVEHEALAGLLARRAGVNVNEVLAVGMSDYDDGLIVIGRLDDRVGDLDADQLDDDLIDAVWEQVERLHGAGLSHGQLNLDHVCLDEEGTPALTGGTAARIEPERAVQDEDVVELMTSLALRVGPDRAIASTRRSLGDDRLSEVLPVMQAAALSPATKQEAHRRKLKVDELRGSTASALGVDEPELEQLQRVSVGNVLMVTVTTLAVYAVISGLADVGFDTIVEALQGAEWGLVLVALVLTQLTNLTDAYSVVAASPKPVPVGITTLEQFAIGFVNLAVPSTAGRVAVNARYFQRFGINAVTSSTTGAITGLVGFVAQMILLLLSIVVGEGSIDLSQLETGGGVLRLLAFALVVLVVSLAVVLLVPRLRHWFLGKVRKPLEQVGDAIRVLRDPVHALKTLGGALTTEILYAAALTLCVLAVGSSVSLGQAVFINVTVSLFAGLMPVPGGIGVSEAGLAAGLTAVGVPDDAAVTAVLVYRLCSYYLPPIWGWVSLHWLTDHDYL